MAITIIMLAISSFPVIGVFAWYHFSKYPISTIKFLIVLLLGATAIFPALIMKYFLPFFEPIKNRLELFYNFFIYGAFIEELSRMFLLLAFTVISGLLVKDSNKEISWKTVKTGTALGLVAGLGFAILENTIYAARTMNISILFLRAVTAAPLHAACGARVGAAAFMFRTNPVQALLRLLTATCIHGIYNLMISLSGFPAIMAILIAFSALITAILSIKGNWDTENQL